MATRTTMAFKRGDNTTHTFSVPIDVYEVGSSLFFGAKEVPDDDNTDALGVIKKTFTDSHVDISDGENAVWSLSFIPSDTSSISFADGSNSKTFKGEFQLVRPTKGVVSYPGNDEYIDVYVYADINRRVA